MAEPIAHLSKILEDQYNEARRVFKDLTLRQPDLYVIEFKGKKKEPKLFQIKVTKNYPREAPEIFGENLFIPLDLPILQIWKPYFQLFHIVKHLKAFYDITVFKPIDHAKVDPELLKYGFDAPSLDDTDYFLNNLPSLQYAKNKLPKAESIIEDHKKSKKDAVIKNSNAIFEKYQTASQHAAHLSELKKSTRLSKADFYKFEIESIDVEINNNQKKINEIVMSLGEKDLSVKGNRTRVINDLLNYEGIDVKLKQKKNVLTDLLNKCSPK